MIASDTLEFNRNSNTFIGKLTDAATATTPIPQSVWVQHGGLILIFERFETVSDCGEVVYVRYHNSIGWWLALFAE